MIVKKQVQPLLRHVYLIYTLKCGLVILIGIYNLLVVFGW